MTKFNTEYDTNHSANDVNKCGLLKTKLRNLIYDTDYPIMPIILKFLGSTKFAKNIILTVKKKIQ